MSRSTRERAAAGAKPDPPGEDLHAVVTRVYGKLRELARRLMQEQAAGHTLEATALVHETFLRLCRSGSPAPEESARFIALAAQTMRSVLVDHARRKNASKRGGERRREPLPTSLAAEAPDPIVVAVDTALEKLDAVDPRKAKLIELRYFAGLSIEEAARVVGVSLATAKRDWVFAKAWLRQQVAPEIARGSTA